MIDNVSSAFFAFVSSYKHLRATNVSLLQFHLTIQPFYQFTEEHTRMPTPGHGIGMQLLLTHLTLRSGGSISHRSEDKHNAEDNNNGKAALPASTSANEKKPDRTRLQRRCAETMDTSTKSCEARTAAHSNFR